RPQVGRRRRQHPRVGRHRNRRRVYLDGDPAPDETLAMTRREVHASHRAVAAGGDIVADVISTGDHNTFFVGSHLTPADAYIHPGRVFRRLQGSRFVGREWVIRELDSFLANNDRGYFVVEGAAGMGKTALLAHLTKERGYIHQLTELTPGP